MSIIYCTFAILNNKIKNMEITELQANEWIIISLDGRIRKKSKDIEKILSFVAASKQTWKLTKVDGRSFQWNGCRVMSVEIC